MNKLKDIPTSDLSRLLGVTTAFISNIKAGRTKLPANTALVISKHFNIPLWELRPDIYPKHLFNCEQKDQTLE